MLNEFPLVPPTIHCRAGSVYMHVCRSTAKGGCGSNTLISWSLRFNGIAVNAKLGSRECIVGGEGGGAQCCSELHTNWRAYTRVSLLHAQPLQPLLQSFPYTSSTHTHSTVLPFSVCVPSDFIWSWISVLRKDWKACKPYKFNDCMVTVIIVRGLRHDPCPFTHPTHTCVHD